MRKFPEGRLMDILNSIPCAVYAPVEENGLVNFARYEAGMRLCLDRIADKSPKDVLFPQWEDLMRFRMEGRSIELTEQARSEEDFVLFGVRACDERAIQVLDRVFLSDPADSYYAARRSHGVVVTLACGEMEESCFCKNFGVDPADPGADLTLWHVENEYYCQERTGKGRALLEKWGTEPADDMPVKLFQDRISQKYESLPFARLNLSELTPEKTMEKFRSPLWRKFSMACLGCGSCTFSCPTCQCYDIRDYDTGHGIERYRCWDSCMYSDFTMMASGTPRPTQLERFRQRFMHKLFYFPANNDGMFACVGCGRCLRKCPMNLHIVKVIRALGEEDAR